jgi:hypothetical protein
VVTWKISRVEESLRKHICLQEVASIAEDPKVTMTLSGMDRKLKFGVGRSNIWKVDTASDQLFLDSFICAFGLPLHGQG